MVIMSEWVYGNGERQRRGEEVSDVFSVRFSLASASAASRSRRHLHRLTMGGTQTLSVVCI